LIWRYFGWANQTLAAVVLWTAAVYWPEPEKVHWIATVPAVFMTAVVVTFIANSTIGLNLPLNIATSIGIGVTFLAIIAFFWKVRQFPVQTRTPSSSDGCAWFCCTRPIGNGRI
jgi:Carbon starvation protein, predicted membrane protein